MKKEAILIILPILLLAPPTLLKDTPDIWCDALFGIFRSHFSYEEYTCELDMNNDYRISALDLSIFASYYFHRQDQKAQIFCQNQIFECL
jgi:hypothetical protein